jgi:hypothetical protein
MPKLLNQITSALVSLLLVFSNVTWAAPDVSASRPSFFHQIHLPESVGRVREVFIPESQPVPASSPERPTDSPAVILVQDAHTSYEAQKNIKEILEYFHKQHGLDLLLLEGAAGKLAPENLKFFNDPALNEAVIEILAKKLEVGGGELFLTDASAQKAKAFGAEEEKAYWKNLLEFRRVHYQHEATQAFLNEIKGGFPS